MAVINLDNLNGKEDLYNRIVDYVAAEGFCLRGNVCVYKLGGVDDTYEESHHCVIGAMIPGYMYNPIIENLSINSRLIPKDIQDYLTEKTGLSLDVLSGIQDCHDDIGTYSPNDFDRFKDKLKKELRLD